MIGNGRNEYKRYSDNQIPIPLEKEYTISADLLWKIIGQNMVNWQWIRDKDF